MTNNQTNHMLLLLLSLTSLLYWKFAVESIQDVHNYSQHVESCNLSEVTHFCTFSLAVYLLLLSPYY